MTPPRIYLVRHAAAEPRHGDDRARRLTPEGRARFAALAEALAGQLSLSRVVTSPYTRARETAEILARATGAPLEEEEALASGGCSGRDLLALGRNLGAGVALVGHNPEVAEAIALAAGGDAEVPAGAVAAVEVDAGGFRLAWLRTPA